MDAEQVYSEDHVGGTFPGSEHPCQGCLHWYGCFENTQCCNYIFDMDKRRPCPAGCGCTVKRPYRGRQDNSLRKARGYLGCTF